MQPDVADVDDKPNLAIIGWAGLVHVLCECEALASLRHAYLGSFFLDPDDDTNVSMGAIMNFGKGTGLL